MNTDDKAKELFEKFLLNQPLCADKTFRNNASKQCAIICVSEILNCLFQHHEIDYWKEVKDKINQL